MVSFSNKKLTPAPLVGATLKKERERRNLTIEDAARGLGLSAGFIKMLETNAWHKLPGQVYTKSFIKKYACWLELNPEKILNQYLEDKKRDVGAVPEREKHPLRNLGLKHFSSLPALFRQVTVSGVIIVLTVYLSYEVAGVFSPPFLMVESPAEGYVNGGQTVMVKGKTEPEAKIQINGQEIVSENTGAFVTDVGLREGLNVIKVSATKRHGGTSTILRNIVVQPGGSSNP